ncbi:Methyl-accepting chemotaxis sensor/transducer protein [hydrothermal vent metagenome]|uniref:Methyl-accepting chemotaxis sensor/transducer protein n=1 Tax=hydrothermal vent metagenome TaxID=652676 RepID=A0A3B1C6L3_9ZZZZ
MKLNLPVTDNEKKLDESSPIISTTDLKGRITYSNDVFQRISGFDKQELLNKSHNIVRHPDMPPVAFDNLWQTLKAGKPWMGIVKNRCKNGDYYWVNAYVMPIEKDGKVCEYQSVRYRPDEKNVQRAEKLYQDLNAGKTSWRQRLPQPGIEQKIMLSIALAFLPWLLASLFVSKFSLSISMSLVVVSFALVYVGVRFSLRHLRLAVEEARKVVQNPVTQRVFTDSQDEGGEITLAMAMLKSQTRAIAGRMLDSSGHLNGTAKDLADSVALTNKGVVHQRNEISSLTSSVEGLRNSAAEVDEHAGLVLEAADGANDNAERGRRVISSTINSIQELASQISQSATIIHTLDKESQRIGGILDAIKAIAEQTNLLALNAAIEAARAGDQGRGFAVVADEVRSLATRTHESTQEIEAMISTLQTEARKAVETMNVGCENAESAVSQAGEAGSALEAILASVKEIYGMSSQISQATNGQVSLVDEIGNNVEMVDEISELTVDTLEGQERISQALDALSGSLDGLSKEFVRLH